MATTDRLGTQALVGSRVRRTEDERLLRGGGRFVDDLGAEAAHAAFVRSELAHAIVVGVDVSRAAAIEGVLGIFTWDDLDGAVGEPLPYIPHPGLQAVRTQHALARDEVCHVGQAIAMVVAIDRYVAEDAVAAIEVAYERLDPMAALADAPPPAAARAHLGLGENVAGGHVEVVGDVDAAMRTAAHRLTAELTIERSAATPMECRAVLARFDAIERRLVVWDTTQAPNNIRQGLARILELDHERVDVVAPDIGGGFGVKLMQFYPEEVLVPWAAIRLGRTVKWTEDRREHFIASNHERGQQHRVEVGTDEDGRIVALDVDFIHDCGAFCHYGLVIPTITAGQLPGPYRIPAYRCRFRALYTNTVPTSVYRGAGRPQAAFVMERVLDRIAQALGLDRAEVRRRNLLLPSDLPYDAGVHLQEGSRAVYDSGDYPAALELALDTVGYRDFPLERAAAERDGRRLGIGLGANVETTGVGPYESATVRVHADGTVAVATGLSTQGQSHETVFAQITADVLDVPLAAVRVTTGDTRHSAYGIGTFSSRAAVVGGSAVHEAAMAVRELALRRGAEVLGVAEHDVELSGGQVRVAGTGDGVPLATLASAVDPLRFAWPGDDRFAHAALGSARRLPHGPGLEATAHFSPPAPAFAYCFHAAVVEIDPATCDVRIVRYVIVHDSGRLLNPLVVEGQIQGGFVQGLAGALFERMAYDADGQLTNASFMDFLIPYATECIDARQMHLESPAPSNPLGVKGVGEAGTIAVSATLAGAIEDATGCRVSRMPLSPNDVFQALYGEEGFTVCREAGTQPTVVATP